MTAEKARELQTGSEKHKGFVFRMRLAWICGQINKGIEREAENGEGSTKLLASVDTGRKYFPLIAKCYEKDGYFIYYAEKEFDKYEMFICWNMEELSEYETRIYTGKTYRSGYKYLYHTEGMIEPSDD